jgi:protoporphyrinogen/coproporphyrinogen III oxidase
MGYRLNPRSIAVVGGGAAGLAAAYYLRRGGCRVEVIEAGSCLGGRMASAKLGNRSIALGGKNIGCRYTLFRQFVRDMGNQPFEKFGLNSSRVRNGRIVTFDGERRWAGLFDLLRNCTLGDILKAARIAAAIKLDRRNAFLGGPYFTALATRRGNSGLASYFSQAFCDEIVRPMSVRMNGAEPDEIALGNFGTNLSMILDNYEQLRDGLDPLFERFAQSGPLRLATRGESLIVREGRVVGLRVRDENGLKELEYDHVVLALPACLAADLVRPHARELAELLETVRYFPVGVVVAGYDRPIFGEVMRALVFPADRALSNAGVYGMNERHIVRYTFSGAAARALLASEPEIEHLLDLGEHTLSSYIPVHRHERISFVGRVMRIGLCAYASDHRGFIAGLHAELCRLRGLELTGDFLQGASIEACFRASLASAVRIGAANAGELEFNALAA